LRTIQFWKRRKKGKSEEISLPTSGLKKGGGDCGGSPLSISKSVKKKEREEEGLCLISLSNLSGTKTRRGKKNYKKGEKGKL